MFHIRKYGESWLKLRICRCDGCQIRKDSILISLSDLSLSVEFFTWDKIIIFLPLRVSFSVDTMISRPREKPRISGECNKGPFVRFLYTTVAAVFVFYSLFDNLDLAATTIRVRNHIALVRWCIISSAA